MIEYLTNDPFPGGYMQHHRGGGCVAYLKSLFDLHQGDHKRSWLPTCGIFLLSHKRAISLDFPSTPPPLGGPKMVNRIQHHHGDSNDSSQTELLDRLRNTWGAPQVKSASCRIRESADTKKEAEQNAAAQALL